MSLHVLGINHQTAPVALREKVAFAPDALAGALASLRALPQVHEAVLLSTCNRTELYAHTDDDGRALADWLARNGWRMCSPAAAGAAIAATSNHSAGQCRQAGTGFIGDFLGKWYPWSGNRRRPASDRQVPALIPSSGRRDP